MSKSSVESHRSTLVVAGIIQSGDRVLISKRPHGESSPFLWEFPGGKVENGESPSDALRREIREELGMETEVIDIYDVISVHRRDHDIYLLFYWCLHIDGHMPECHEVASWTWAKRSELSNYKFLEADVPLIKKIEKDGFPKR